MQPTFIDHWLCINQFFFHLNILQLLTVLEEGHKSTVSIKYLVQSQTDTGRSALLSLSVYCAVINAL